MPSIEDVIAQSRKGGGFAKVRHFTLAQDKAIEKMRSFALADPSFYVLELIQAAVANGATAVDIEVEEDEVCFSYVGGGIDRDDLAHLFDFLFASKDRLEVVHLRELALGLNTLLLFEPDEIILVSGRGGANATRLVLRDQGQSVDIGEADFALEGTFIRATMLKRHRVKARGFTRSGEAEAIETHCLAAPVPILLNMKAPFGAGRARTPIPWGYSPTLAFDEGDLYGSVGLCNLQAKPSFRLLTFGVWVQSAEIPMLAGQPIGGIVSFDRLHKTADHSGIVRDDVFEEMCLRVRPYAQKLVSGRPVPGLHDVALLSGQPIVPRDLRPWLRRARRVVLAPAGTTSGSRTGKLAAAIGSALSSPVVTCPKTEMGSLRHIAGAEVSVIEPALVDQAEVDFYQQPPAQPPPQPWLASPLATPDISLTALPKEMAERLDSTRRLPARLRQALAKRLGGVGHVTGLLYAPEDPGPARSGVWVQVLTTDRLVWEGELPSAFPGQWLVVRIPDVPPGWLRGLVSGIPVAKHVAQHLLAKSQRQQQELCQRALGFAFARPGAPRPGASNLALRALSLQALVRLRSGRKGLPGVSITLLEKDQALLRLPLVNTLDGTPRTALDLAALLDQTGGLIYGVIPEVQPFLEGLDRTRILSLDLDRERLLLSLLGEATYVRIDRRDVLAASDGLQCRDLALGLRRYPNFPLLVEGADPAVLPGPRRRQCLHRLSHQLIDCFMGTAPGRPTDPARYPDWEENRRQACRHLQWLACHEMEEPTPELQELRILDLPLFLDTGGRATCARLVREALQSPDGLVLNFGTALGASELGTLAAAAGHGLPASTLPPTALAVSPFLARLLFRLGKVRLDFDFDLCAAEASLAAPGTTFLEEVAIHGSGFAGRIGIPSGSAPEAGVLVLGANHRPIDSLVQEAHVHGVVGFATIARSSWDAADREELSAAIDQGIDRLMEKLTLRLGERRRGENDRTRLEEQLLSYADRQLRLIAAPAGVVMPSVLKPQAQAILQLPLFSLGGGAFTSAWRLILEFCNFGVAAFEDTHRKIELQQVLRSEKGRHLTAWLRQLLQEGRIVRPSADDERREAVPRPLPARQQDALERVSDILTSWLDRLRPDEHLGQPGRRQATQVTLEPLIREPDMRVPGKAREEPFASYRETFGAQGRPSSSLLRVNREHWLVHRCLAARSNPEPLAWLLLACYAAINEALFPVTNEHEMEFQRRVLETLESGNLRVEIDR